MTAQSSIPTLFRSPLTQWKRSSQSLLRALRVLRGEPIRPTILNAAERRRRTINVTTKSAKSAKEKSRESENKTFSAILQYGVLQWMSNPKRLFSGVRPHYLACLRDENRVCGAKTSVHQNRRRRQAFYRARPDPRPTRFSPLPPPNTMPIANGKVRSVRLLG